jgi:hypothetical protein
MDAVNFADAADLIARPNSVDTARGEDQHEPI